MPRSHGTNSDFDNHRYIMERQVDRYAYAFDDSFVSVVSQGQAASIPGNRLHFDDQSYPDQAICIGEFRFEKSKVKHPAVRLSVQKWIQLLPAQLQSRRSSQTIKYRYNLWLEY